MKKSMKITILLIFIAVVLLGCHMQENPNGEYPELIYKIDHMDHSFTEAPEYHWLIAKIKEKSLIDHFWEDTTLQAAAAKIAHTPLNNDDAITAYAWDILPQLIQSKYVAPDQIPICASYYEDYGIICILYDKDYTTMDRKELLEVIFDFCPHLFISASDGHVIYILGQMGQ